MEFPSPHSGLIGKEEGYVRQKKSSFHTGETLARSLLRIFPPPTSGHRYSPWQINERGFQFFFFFFFAVGDGTFGVFICESLFVELQHDGQDSNRSEYDRILPVLLFFCNVRRKASSQYITSTQASSTVSVERKKEGETELFFLNI